MPQVTWPSGHDGPGTLVVDGLSPLVVCRTVAVVVGISRLVVLIVDVFSVVSRVVVPRVAVRVDVAVDVVVGVVVDPVAGVVAGFVVVVVVVFVVVDVIVDVVLVVVFVVDVVVEAFARDVVIVGTFDSVVVGGLLE